VQVGLFRDALGQRNDLESSAPMIEAARRVVGAALLGDIADMVGDARRIVVCPDGYLNTVPFLLLAVPGVEALGRHAEIVRIPVASMLRRRGGGRSGGILAVTGSDPGLGGATAEVRDLEARFRHVTVTRGMAPHLADSLAVHSVVHVAAHVDVDDTRPWHSGIRLDPSAPRSHLRASDVLGLQLYGRLAVLAACESGLGRVSRGQGVLGLSSAFLVSGMESVVATLWRVDDQATRSLMKAFYDELAAGAPVAQALGRARNRLRERPATAHPYYWAAFVLVGAGESSVELEEKSAGERLALFGLGLFAAVVFIFVLKNRRSA
jgi:CHAT domain-containing protein